MPKQITAFTGEYAWLSNFYPVEITYNGETYPTLEHAYQAAKFREPVVRDKIRRAPTPGAAKQQARLWPITTPKWHVARLEVMADLLAQKFKRPDLAMQLVGTGDAELIEGNWWRDTYWGVHNGKGENYLGRLLMEQRKRLGGVGFVSAVDDFDLGLETDITDDFDLGV